MQIEQVSTRSLAILIGALALLLAVTAGADDGVREINQACAVNTGCFAGDAAGFPVQITGTGSYLLTGDLDAGVDQQAVTVSAGNVTLDLNGFQILGAGNALRDGILLGGSANAEIRNGTIEGFGRHGILVLSDSPSARVIDIRAVGQAFNGIELQSEGALVRGCTASGNAIGIKATDGSLVLDSIMHNNSDVGLQIPTGSGYGRNVLSDNNGGDANPQVSGTGSEVAVNLCGANTTCP